MDLDSVDLALITLLKGNARMSLSQLSRHLGLARSTVQSRLLRLEKSGTIAGYSAKMGAELTKRWVHAHALIVVEPRAQVEIEAKLKQMPEVTALYSVSGNVDLIAHLAAANTTQLDEALDQVRAMTGVQSTITNIILSTRFER
jgi:DNA-binding Lrp family transcriptional regulator